MQIRLRQLFFSSLSITVVAFNSLMLPIAASAQPRLQVAEAYACILPDSDGDAICACPSGQARATVFLHGAENDSSLASVCLDNLGLYNPETGQKISSNYDSARHAYLLNGKYLQTDVETLTPTFQRFGKPSNDFVVNPSGDATSPARNASVWGSEVHLYYYINDYRKRFATASFISGLGFPTELRNNIVNRQFRPDLQGIINARLPKLISQELSSLNPWSTNVAANDFRAPTQQRASSSDSLNTLALDPDYVIGEYTGAVANWFANGTTPWPTDATWGNVGNQSWHTDIRPAILEGFKLWNAYRYSGQKEVYRYAERVLRRWQGYSCGGTNQAACNKGRNIENAMMYLDTADPVLNNPTNPSWPAANSDDTLLFPFATNYPTTGVRAGAGLNHQGPTNGALGGMFIAAIFYDISKDIGLGDAQTDRLFWKTMSLINPGQPLDMTAFGVLVQQAARALWPTILNPNISWYEQDLVNVFAARGVRMNGVSNFLDNVPAALGTAANPGPGTLLTASTVGVGSSIPETQRNSSTGYNFLSYFQNGYQISTANTQYVTYQFYKGSKYGPCDSLDVTNGTFNVPASATNPIMNSDGAMAVNYTGRDLGNTLILAPGNTLRFLRRRQSCVSEHEGYYAEDVRPFGFRAIKAIPNGFTFRVTKTGFGNGRYTYQLAIVDPSLTMSGQNTGPATYNWQFTEYDGTVVNATGELVSYNALLNQPFTLSVTRVRGAQSDNITLRERGNDMDRNSGKQFNQDYWNPGYRVGFDTIVNRRLVEGHGSYNSALNPVGGAFGVQAHRWTTPNAIVQPLRFSTVSHGLGSGTNQNGPYRFADAVYYNACIWGDRTNVTNAPGCHSDEVAGDYEVQVPFSQVGITLGDPFAIVTAASLPAYLWTVNYPAGWRLQPNREYHFGGHISASVVNNGYSYNVCSYAPAAWDGTTAGNSADRSDWLAGANWSGQNGAPPPQTMRQYLSSANSVSNCTFAAYRFEGQTVNQ